MALTHAELKMEMERIKTKTYNQDKNIEILFRYFDELFEQKNTPKKLIGYKLPKKKR